MEERIKSIQRTARKLKLDNGNLTDFEAMQIALSLERNTLLSDHLTHVAGLSAEKLESKEPAGEKSEENEEVKEPENQDGSDVPTEGKASEVTAVAGE